jgi:hypothetical protein
MSLGGNIPPPIGSRVNQFNGEENAKYFTNSVVKQASVLSPYQVFSFDLDF